MAFAEILQVGHVWMDEGSSELLVLAQYHHVFNEGRFAKLFFDVRNGLMYCQRMS